MRIDEGQSGELTRLRACWATQAPFGLAVTPARCTLRKLDEDQHVQPLEQDRVDGEEVAGEDAVGLLAEELDPAAARAVWRWWHALATGDRPDDPRSYRNSQAHQLA